MNKLLVTGSSGLIGSEAVEYFCKLGWAVHGVDNNRRANFFGPSVDTRWDPPYSRGTAEDFPIDQSKHGIFGASKTAADVVVQDYGRYFGIKTCCLRGGCPTGQNHSGVELHYAMIPGIRRSRSIRSIFKLIAHGYKLICHEGKNYTFIHPATGTL